MQKQQQVSLSKQNINEQQILQQQLQTDFLTVLALATDVQETINYFKQVSDHVMIDIQMNKLILQLNISSMLHCEIVDNIQQSHSQCQQTYLDQTKENYIQFTKYVLTNYRFDPIIQGKLSRYIENQLSKHPKMQMEQGKKVNLQKNFDASVAESVIHGTIQYKVKMKARHFQGISIFQLYFTYNLLKFPLIFLKKQLSIVFQIQQLLISQLFLRKSATVKIFALFFKEERYGYPAWQIDSTSIQKSDMQFEKIRNGEKVAEINQDQINQYIQQRQEQAKAGLDLKWREKKLDKKYINLKN